VGFDLSMVIGERKLSMLKVEQTTLTKLGVDTKIIKDENGNKREVLDHDAIKNALLGHIGETSESSKEMDDDEKCNAIAHKLANNQDFFNEMTNAFNVKKGG
tara:strand:- start:33 stop:338 length:306 start_codon:yes stop_codon:yes gene_type:complete